MNNYSLAFVSKSSAAQIDKFNNPQTLWSLSENEVRLLYGMAS